MDIAVNSLPFATIDQAIDWFCNNDSKQLETLAIKSFEQMLFDAGETQIIHLMASIERRLNCNLSPYQIPDINPDKIAAAGWSRAENGELYEIPCSLEQYQTERLRLMTKVACQRLLGRKVIVNVGIGYIGTANIAAAASAINATGKPAYLVIGYQRPSAHSSWKVNFMNRGLPTITTADNSLAERIEQAHQQGNLTATFLQEQSLAVADIIFVETELHVRKYSPRAIERSEADPAATLHLLRQIAQIMPARALLVIESTVYPGFTLNDALPEVNRILRRRGLISETENASLAYGFHRVKPGPQFMESFFSIPRDAGGVTPEAADQLENYYQTTGINYQLHDDITASELMKDIENASKFGLLDLMSAFMKSAEATGIDGFSVIRSIARARPEEHGRYVEEIAGLQVGGYCVPKELGLLINGLRRHFDVSELNIRQMFYSRIVAASISDYRAEDAVYHIIRTLGKNQKSITNSQLYWAGVSYKEGVGDTRMAGTERGLRYAAHLGAANRVTDPMVVNWPEIQKQRLGDPECWGHGLNNQESLRDLQVHTAESLQAFFSPDDDAVILAVRHPSYLGKHKPAIERTDANGKIHPGIDAVDLSARSFGKPGKIILDTFDFLSDDDIREFLALGWHVQGFGKGHIDRLKQTISDQWKIELRQAVIESMRLMAENGGNQYQSPDELLEAVESMSIHAEASALSPLSEQTQAVSQEQHLLDRPRQQLFSCFRQTGELLIALADNFQLLRNAETVDEIADQLQSLRYLRHAGFDGLNQDLDRVAYELMQEGASLKVAATLRQIRRRPELSISNQPVKHPLFNQAIAPQARLLPATVFNSDGNGRLKKIEDPQGLPYRLSTKWVPDLAALLENKQAFPQAWSKFSVEVPIFLCKVSDEPVEFDLYEDFLYLPLEFRDWLINQVWKKGYVLTTLEGESQDKISYLMDVNLDPVTVARGRGGIIFWQDSREPVILTTPEGHEIPLELKAIGDYQGGSPDKLQVNYNRTIISGRVEGGGTAKTNLGQVPGHMFSADDINWQERLKTSGPYHEGKTPRSVFRVRWSYPGKAGELFQMIGRGSPSTMRLGHVLPGTSEYDVKPEKSAYILGWNNAEIIGHDIAAVHIALNLDNVMSNGYYTDTGSNIDLFCERDPKGSFRDYGGYGLLMVMYTYSQMKSFQENQSKLPRADTRFLQPWLNGFLDRFLQLDEGRKIANRAPFLAFYNVQQHLEINEANAEKIIDDWLDTLWQHYVPYHVLRNRITRGFDPAIETPFTTGHDHRMFDSNDADKALKFLDSQQEVIRLAKQIGDELKRPLPFDFESAQTEIDERRQQVIKRDQQDSQHDFHDIYQLPFYQSLDEDVYTVLDPEDQNRLLLSRARPTVFIDKMDANINQRMRLSGLRLIKMAERTEQQSIIEIVAAYVKVWKGPESHAPGEYDIQSQSSVSELLRLIQKDFRMASMLNQASLKRFEALQWKSFDDDNNTIMVSYSLDREQGEFSLDADGQLIKKRLAREVDKP